MPIWRSVIGHACRVLHCSPSRFWLSYERGLDESRNTVDRSLSGWSSRAQLYGDGMSPLATHYPGNLCPRLSSGGVRVVYKSLAGTDGTPPRRAFAGPFFSLGPHPRARSVGISGPVFPLALLLTSTTVP